MDGVVFFMMLNTRNKKKPKVVTKCAQKNMCYENFTV